MAQHQHRQACLAHWPGHHSRSTEARRRRRNSQEGSQRSKVEDQGGDTMVQPRLWQQGHRPEAAPAKGAASCSRPSIAWRWRRGCSSRPTDATTRRTPQAPEEGRSSSKARRSRPSRVGKIYWGRARRRWRQLEAEGTKPHGQEGARDAAK
jgi:hypothetical protein